MIKQLILSAILACQSVAFADTADRDEFERRSCADFDRQPVLCDRQPNCAFDHRANICDDRRGGDPNPGFNCWELDRNPRLCDLAPRCTYDRRRAQCVDDFGPGPGPGPGSRDFWECSAVDEGWEEHRGGHVAEARGRRLAENAALRQCERYHGRCVIRSCRQR